METKLYPHAKNPMFEDDGITHTPEDIRKHLDLSLKALNTDKIEMFYLRERTSFLTHSSESVTNACACIFSSSFR